MEKLNIFSSINDVELQKDDKHRKIYHIVGKF